MGKMDYYNLILILAVIIIVVVAILFLIIRTAAKVGGVYTLRRVASITLRTTLPGTVFPNTRYFLPGANALVFQLLPGSTGDFAVLVNSDGTVRVLPENTAITPNTDYSNITGYSLVPNLIAFGGGEMAPSPWSPCAFPCAPYVAFYVNNSLQVVKIPGGSCDNMNTTAIVRGFNGDVIAIGGANPNSATGGTGYVIFNASLNAYKFGTLSIRDSAGNAVYMYRRPSVTIGDNVYMIASVNTTNTIAIEKVPLQTLYNSATNSPSTLCFTNIVTPIYVNTIATDFNHYGVVPIYTDGTNIYILYYSTSGYIKLIKYDTFSNTYNTKQLIYAPNTSNTSIALADGRAYIANQNGDNTTTLYIFDLNGNLLFTTTMTGVVLVDMNGYIIQITSGYVNGTIPAGAQINIFRVEQVPFSFGKKLF